MGQRLRFGYGMGALPMVQIKKKYRCGLCRLVHYKKFRETEIIYQDKHMLIILGRTRKVPMAVAKKHGYASKWLKLYMENRAYAWFGLEITFYENKENPSVKNHYHFHIYEGLVAWWEGKVESR